MSAIAVIRCLRHVAAVALVAAAIVPAQAQFYAPGVQDLSKKKQHVIDTSQLDVRYTYREHRNPSDPKDTLGDQQQLLLGRAVAWYRSLNLAASDSACSAEWSRGRSASNAPRGTSGEWVYRGYPQVGKSLIMWRIGDYDFLQCSEDVPEQQWLLHPETRQIAGHQCQRATCLFRGREWTAWYATDLPVPEGPWKLRGLPGLIMHAHDKNHEHEWCCTGIGSRPQLIIWYDMDWDRTTRAKMRERISWVAAHPITYMCENSDDGIIYIGRSKVTPAEAGKYDERYSSLYNSIELD